MPTITRFDNYSEIVENIQYLEFVYECSWVSQMTINSKSGSSFRETVTCGAVNTSDFLLKGGYTILLFSLHFFTVLRPRIIAMNTCAGHHHPTEDVSEALLVSGGSIR